MAYALTLYPISFVSEETTEDKINHLAIDFIKRVNAMVHTDYKGVLMIAEDSSSFPKVTHSLEDGGLGFDMKWDLGWMNDKLKYIGRPSVYRKYHSNEITFGMYYNQNEHFLLPLSHDEVVHGKHSIIEKMDKITKTNLIWRVPTIASFLPIW